MKDAAGIAYCAEPWRRKLIELSQRVVSGRFAVDITVIGALQVLVESLETYAELISDRGRDAREGQRRHVIEEWDRVE